MTGADGTPPAASRPTAPAPVLPVEMQLLFIGAEEPSWSLLALQLDRYGCTEARFRWSSDPLDAAERLRQEHFDAVIVDDVSVPSRDLFAGHSPLEFVSALRAGGSVDPILLLSDRVDDSCLAEAAGLDCELLTTPTGWRSVALSPWLVRCLERWRAARERERIDFDRQTRLARDVDESERRMQELRGVAQRLHSEAGPEPPASIITQYQDALRAAVMVHRGELGGIADACLESFSTAAVTPPRYLALHVSTVETLLRGLGSRSGRHLLERANLLAIEVLSRLPRGTDSLTD